MADIRIHTKIMPLFHAVILIRGQRIILINFANDRTKVNGMPAEDVTYLFHGDIINFGDTEFTFQRAKTIHIDLTNEQDNANIIDISYNSDSESETSSSNYIELTNKQNKINVIDLSHNNETSVDLTNEPADINMIEINNNNNDYEKTNTHEHEYIDLTETNENFIDLMTIWTNNNSKQKKNTNKQQFKPFFQSSNISDSSRNNEFWTQWNQQNN